jgi:capsular polysaccharide biosynthesis protein
MLIIAGGMMFGMVFGIISALVAETLDSRIRSLTDLEAYRLPVIGLLPEVNAGH